MKAVKEILQSFLGSSYSIGLQLILACIFASVGMEIAGLLVFVVFISLILFTCDDLFHTFLPFMLISMTVLKCYDSFDIFIKIQASEYEDPTDEDIEELKELFEENLEIIIYKYI